MKKNYDNIKIKSLPQPVIAGKNKGFFKGTLERIKQTVIYVNTKNVYLPKIKIILYRIIYSVAWSFLILLSLRFLNYKVTWFNLLSAWALFFIIQEVADYILKMRNKR
jgi:hypothetical protein